MVFSWDLRVNNQSVTLPFGGLKFTHSLSGFGTSGIVTGQFEFDLYDEFGQYGEYLLEHVPAQLFCRNNSAVYSRVYYVAKRSISKKVCHFTAYDIGSDLEKEFDPSDLWQGEPEDTISYTAIINALRSQCGFAFVTAAYDGMSGIKFTKEMLKGKSCRSVFEMISTAMCGIWCSNGIGGLQLICLSSDKMAYADSGICTEYTEIDYQGRQKITKLIAVNSETGNVVEHSTGEYGTVIKIESPFVACDDGTDGYVWQRINGLVYQSWKCDKALMDLSRDTKVFNTISTLFTFGEDTELLVNQVVFDVDSSGIYFSGGADPQSDEVWKYDDYTQRQLKQKIEPGKAFGDAMLTSGGEYVFFVNEN